MGLTAGQYLCLNCRKYRFDNEDLEGKKVETGNKRGHVQISVTCSNCGAEMLYVFFKSMELKPAIAYRHTCNDEPCYGENCRMCYGEEAEEEVNQP